MSTFYKLRYSEYCYTVIIYFISCGKIKELIQKKQCKDITEAFILLRFSLHCITTLHYLPYIISPSLQYMKTQNEKLSYFPSYLQTIFHYPLVTLSKMQMQTIPSTTFFHTRLVTAKKRLIMILISEVSGCVYSLNFQMQPPEVFYKKKCSQKFRKIHRKTPVQEYVF